MKVIFLDIDGVLNSFQTFREIYYEYKKTGIRRVAIDEEKVKLLKEIVDKTNAKLVLSSSWRIWVKKVNNKIVTDNKNFQKMLEILAKYDLYIYDMTPKNKDRIRELEIKEWLNNTSDDIENFIVIDDDIGDLHSFADKELVKTCFITTDGKGNYLANKSGLTVEHVNEAITKLNTSKILKKI